ncbi:MAG: glycosyltransferase [Fibrobacteraceae bacterium]|nr:glycosyltransferase [Fibrobacteraceae bacterium]
MNSVHVVLCTYNGEKYLGEMLNSLVAQTYPCKTVIALDDASKDSTYKILESFHDKLPIKIFCNENNTGHRAAFSKALDLAKPFIEPGDYVALADQDDIWDAKKNELLVKNIGNASLVFGDAQVIDGEGNLTARSWRKLAHIGTDTNIQRQIAGINNVTGMLSLFKGELLEKILPIPKGVTVHDRWIAMVAQKNKTPKGEGGVKAISHVVAQYRIHGENAVGGTAIPSMSKTLEIAYSWTQTIIANNNRLNLSSAELLFAQKHLNWIKHKQTRAFAFKYLPWIIKNQNQLFLQTSIFKRFMQMTFSCIGLSTAKKFLGKK